MGWPLLPWQRYVADVAGEVDGEGVLFYDTIVITVQRQAGKTTLDVAAAIQNAMLGPRRRCWYTAQTGQHASDKWRDMIDNYFMESPLKHLGHANYSNGAQMLKLPGGSTFRPHPPTEDSLHSKQSDRNTVDEAWAFDAIKWKALLGAIVPTTTTRRAVTGQRPQLWIMSTEGTAESEALNTLLKKLRAGAIPERTAFFDWGIPPEINLPDIDNPREVDMFIDIIWDHHPGAGYLFAREDLLGHLSNLGLSEFARAYGNRRTGATERVIPEADWTAAGSLDLAPPGAPIAFGAASSLDGLDTTITATAYLPDGRKITEVVEHGAGVAWAPARLKDLCEKFDTSAVIDRAGPSADLYDRAARADVPLIEIQGREYAGACQSVFGGVVNRDTNGEKLPPTWLHRPHAVLNAAADTAAKRSVGDGAWAWGRRASAGSVAALEAASLSSWAVDHLPERLPLQIL